MNTVPLDDSLLDLFRTEAAAQLAVMAENMDGLDAGAAGGKGAENLFNAVQSLKGAARLVNLDLAAQLAQAMEKILGAARARKRNPEALVVDAVRRAAAWLAHFSQISAAEMANPPATIRDEQAALLLELSILTPKEEGKGEGRRAKGAVKMENGKWKMEKAGGGELKAGSGERGVGSLESEDFESPPGSNEKPETRNPKPETAPLPQASKLDFSLLDLFRVEAETQLAALAQGVVELEGDLANPKRIEPVMRAAHSLKGAARIIGLDLMVQLTHTMEDALVAAQKGRLALNAEGIDALLRAGDWLGVFAKLPQDQLAAPPAELVEAQAKCLAEMEAVLAGRAGKMEDGKWKMEKAGEGRGAKGEAGESERGAGSRERGAGETEIGNLKSAEGAGEKSEARIPKPETVAVVTGDPVVRVSATSLSRLMGLAAETLVEARRLEPFRDNLLKLKNQQRRFVSQLEAAAQAQTAAGVAATQSLDQLRGAAQATLEGLRTQVDNFDNAARRSTLASGRLYQEVIASRMRPFADGAQAFPRLVRDVCRTLGKQARLEIEGRTTPVDRDILEKLEAPLGHLLRNACDHGLETPEERRAAGKPEAGVIRVEARHRAGMLVVQVSDDGRGVSLPRLREKIVEQGRADPGMAAAMNEDEVLQFLFLPGFSTAEKITELSGRGVGLDVVQSLMQEVGGAVRIFSTAGRGTMFQMQLPVTRSVVRALLVEMDGEAYAFALVKLHRALRVPRSSVERVNGHPQIVVDGAEARLVSGRRALGLPGETHSHGEEIAVVVVGGGGRLYALEVDRILGESDLVVRPLDARLGKVPGISAAALNEDGAPVLIVDVDDLQGGMAKLAAGEMPAGPTLATTEDRPRVLVVDDSATVRATARQILDGAGYAVEVAVDGADGWNAVRLGKFDLVVSDVDMPRLNGLEFVARLRAEPRLRQMPVIFVSYKAREEDRAAGLAAGADVYLIKSSLADGTFLGAVQELLAARKSSP